jgi:hypothetical protein
LSGVSWKRKSREPGKNPEDRKPLDMYVTERPMFVRGEIATITQIMNDYNLTDRCGEMIDI